MSLSCGFQGVEHFMTEIQYLFMSFESPLLLFRGTWEHIYDSKSKVSSEHLSHLFAQILHGNSSCMTQPLQDRKAFD